MLPESKPYNFLDAFQTKIRLFWKTIFRKMFENCSKGDGFKLTFWKKNDIFRVVI